MSHLRPPLRAAWSYPGVVNVYLLPDRQSLLAPLYPKGLVSLDVAGRENWRISGEFNDGFVVEGKEAFTATGSSLCRIDLGTGKIRSVPFGDNRLLAVDGEKVITWSYKSDHKSETYESSIRRTKLNDGRTLLWEFQDSGSIMTPKHFGYNTMVSGDSIFAHRHPARLVCLDVETGKTNWVVDLNQTKEDPSVGVAADLRVGPVVFGNKVLAATPFGIAAFDAGTGALLWSHHVHAGPFSPYGDRLYVVTGLNYTGYRVVDMNTGSALLDREVSDDIARAFYFEERVGLESSLAVTETHTFVGDNVGRLWALERDTGEPVWFDHPETATPYVAVRVPIISEGRLYINGFSMDPDRPQHLYCYEQA